MGNGRYCPNVAMISLARATRRAIDVFVDALDFAEMSLRGRGTGGDGSAIVPPLGSPEALHLR